jgi:hypothetical protein
VDLRDKPVFAGASAYVAPYINNAYGTIPLAPIPANIFRTESLSGLALRIRRAILAFNADPNGIAADLYGHCSHPLKVWFPSPPRGEVTIQSNWRKARFSSLDFSGAVVGEEAQARVKLSLFGLRSTHPKRGLGLVLMEDEEAVWLSQFLGVKEWEDIRSNVVVTFI